MEKRPTDSEQVRIKASTGEPLAVSPRAERWDGIERRGPDRRLRDRRTIVPDKAIEARISSFARGIEIIPGVQLVRIDSKTYNLLIMVDYTSLLGEIDGTVEIVTLNDRVLYENIRAFYCLKDNVFELMIKESSDAYLG